MNVIFIKLIYYFFSIKYEFLSKKSEQIKEIELDNNHNDIQIDILDDFQDRR